MGLEENAANNMKQNKVHVQERSPIEIITQEEKLEPKAQQQEVKNCRTSEGKEIFP